MWRNKYISFVLILCFGSANKVAAQSTFRANDFLIGPQFGAGLTMGKRVDYQNDVYFKKPGPAVQFGISAYRFHSASQAFGVSLLFQQTKWLFSTKQSATNLYSDTRYAVNEKNLLLPLEFNAYFTPYRIRGFFGFGAVPGYLTGKTLQRMRASAGDTTTAAILPELNSYNRFSMGLSAKIGLDGDMDFHHSGRIFLEFNSRFYSSKQRKNSHTYGVFLVAQFFFSEF